MFPWSGPEYRFQNFGKCNLGEYPLAPGDELSGEGSGHFPKLPKRVCTAKQGPHFGTLSFTAKLGLPDACCVSTCLLLRDVWVKP